MQTTNSNEEFMRCWTKAVPAVSAFVHSLEPDFHQAQDILQEVAIVLSRKFDQYDPTRPFVAWAIGVAKNVVLMERRTRARRPMTYHSDIVETVGAACAELEPEFDSRSVTLRECLGGVSQHYQEILKLRYVEELKPLKIAERQGMSSGAIRILLFRIHKALEICIQRKLSFQKA